MVKCESCGKDVGDIPYASMFARCPYCKKDVYKIKRKS